MILTCNFEELRALATGADLLLGSLDTGGESAVAAPAEALAQVELLRPRLTGDLSVSTLSQQRSLRSAIALIRGELQDRLEETVLEFHPGHEQSIVMYFDYAHAVSVLNRVDQMGAEMTAMIELMTGTAPTERTAASIAFPD